MSTETSTEKIDARAMIEALLEQYRSMNQGEALESQPRDSEESNINADFIGSDSSSEYVEA